MGLTKEQYLKKRTDEIIKYVEENGTSISATVKYWGTYPICVKDICVLGVAVKGKKTKQLMFGDYDGKKFIPRKSADSLERNFLEEVLIDMMAADGKKSRLKDLADKKAAKKAAKKEASKTYKKKN